MARLFDVDTFDLTVLPDEPLNNGWAHKWDDDALDYRFERFGLAPKRGSKGISDRALDDAKCPEASRTARLTSCLLRSAKCCRI